MNVYVVFGFAGPIDAGAADVGGKPGRTGGQRHLQIAGPVFLSVSPPVAVGGRLARGDVNGAFQAKTGAEALNHETETSASWSEATPRAR